MIYLQEGNFPLNEAFSSEIVQEANSTYQLTFKFPTSDPKWALLTPETELVADDLHGEQYFTIFEVEKQHGYVTVYANQVATLLNGYSINKINVDRVNGATVMNALVAGFKRETPFTFFSDVMSKHTLNLKDISAMEALAKDKHSIVGQWGGDLVRDKYSVRLLENGGIENESLFAYKKNMKSFQESKSTKELRTRIHFKKVIEAHEEGKKDQILTVTIDSPLINKYKHIYEADMEVQDQDVVDQKTLEEYGKRYFRETLCDMIEESLEIDVVGQADQPVHMFDIVSIFHEGYDVDLRKKITKYKFNPMSIKLVSIGFGEVARTLADSISGMVNDSVDKKMKSYDAEYEAKVQKLVDNANAEYDKQAKELEHKITDGIEQAKAQAEVVKQEISAKVTEKINAANQANKNEIVEEFKARYNGIEVKMQGLEATTDQLKTSDADIKKIINDFKDQTQSQFAGIQGAQSRFEQTTEKAISDLTNVTNGKADRSYVEQTVNGIREEFTSIGVSGGPNMLRNSRADDGLKYWTEPNGKMSFTAHNFYFNGQKRMFFLSSGASVHSPRFIIKQNTNYMLNLIAFDANTARFKIAFCKRRKGSTNDFDEMQIIFDKTGSPAFNSDRAVKKSFSFNTGAFDEGYLLFNYQGNPNVWSGLFMTELDFYESNNERKWQPAPEDQNYLVEQAQATFEKTVEGLSAQLTKLETKTGPSGELEQRMLTYSEKAAVDAVKATRQILEQGYVAKSQYTEDVAGITRRFDEIVQAGENLLKNSGNPQNVDGWGYYDPGLIPVVTVSTNPIYYNESRKLFKIENASDTTKVAASQRFNIKRNTTYTISFDAIGSDNLKAATFYFLARKKGETGTFTKVFTLADKIAIPQDRITRYYFTVNSEEYDEAFLRFDNTGSSNGQPASLYFGDIDVYEGSIKRAYQPPTDDGSSVIEAKLAEYKQTVDGQFTTITNQIGDMVRKTDIQITPSQISFGTGKSINGKTISSLMVQEPDSIALIAQLIKVKGDMVVDGSITSRHLASQSVRTGHMESGSVTTQILASNAVTADKLLVDSAMINKLVSNQAFIRELTSQRAFITQLNSVAVSAEKIQGGRLTSNTGSMVFDLDNSSLNMMTDTASIRRVYNGYPTQFIKYETARESNQNISRTIIGSNRKGTEVWNSVSFSGLVVENFSGSGVDRLYMFGDESKFRHSQSEEGWNLQAVTQSFSPATWNKSSSVWARHIVVPKKTRSDTDNPEGFVRLEESVAALWKLWAHAKGQVTMSGAMQNKIQSMLDAWSFERDTIK
ncbi:phage tail spike protein [uncultured Streptococcus sp.]|uniref:phage tail spike protein n=1 Tax=uncultured Streptococcus sp. TaxID=83427 RepID=UPI0028F137E9|nr:phage tail spike protein [uncultured Streptococcus sp.]